MRTRFTHKAAIALLVLAMGSTVGGCAAHGATHATAIDPAGTAPEQGLSETTLRSFKAFGTEFTTSQDQAKVTADEAVAASAGAYGLVTGEPAEIALGRLTVPTYGREVSKDPAVSVIDPYIKDRLVWMVVYDDVPQPGGSGGVQTDEDGKPIYSETPPTNDLVMTTGLWVAVDAQTGEVLRGESIGDGTN